MIALSCIRGLSLATVFLPAVFGLATIVSECLPARLQWRSSTAISLWFISFWASWGAGFAWMHFEPSSNFENGPTRAANVATSYGFIVLSAHGFLVSLGMSVTTMTLRLWEASPTKALYSNIYIWFAGEGGARFAKLLMIFADPNLEEHILQLAHYMHNSFSLCCPVIVLSVIGRDRLFNVKVNACRNEFGVRVLLARFIPSLGT